ncbi:MAG: MEKHLA domain-containing protein [Alkalinema sp. CAN_BIN05]|nr:MEKHLA domain-containing protein [Alkalinema sp. CAN_BIN05]
MSRSAIFTTASLIEHSQYLLNSFKALTGHDLTDRSPSIEMQANNLFHANFVTVSHDTQPDPIFNYGNQTALDLWEFDWEHFLELPSRLSAEPLAQIDRDRLLLEAKNNGYIQNYRGVRISRTGKRFWVQNATIWTVTDSQGKDIGQAATFLKWSPIIEEVT